MSGKNPPTCLFRNEGTAASVLRLELSKWFPVFHWRLMEYTPLKTTSGSYKVKDVHVNCLLQRPLLGKDIFLLPVEYLLKWIRIWLEIETEKWKHDFQDTRFKWMCNKLIHITGIWFYSFLGLFSFPLSLFPIPLPSFSPCLL